VTAWVYRSAEEKRRLVGAAATEYAKPWLSEIHLVDAPLPHPILRHEVVHAVAAPVAGGLFGVPARAGVVISAGLLEGLASALETPRGRWTVHQWSRAARDLGLLPDVTRIVGPAGFWSQAPARAYTAAGSFLGFLLERHGAEKVRAAYRSGDVASAMGVPLPALADEWQRFLDGVEPGPGVLLAARGRLSRPSLFARPCAREVATLEARAAAAAAGGRTAEACALYAKAAAQTGSAADLKAAADVRVRAGDLDGAAEGYRAAAIAAGEDGALRAAVVAAQGDLAWRRDEIAAAVSAWTTALATRPERGDERLLEAKVVAAADPELGPAVRPLLLGDGDPAVALAEAASVPRPLSAYLLGRALAARGEASRAEPELARAVAGPLPPALAREAALLLGGARCAAGDRAAGEATLRPLAERGSAADRARADEALRRCAAR
jgi:tetratricopeptide (TPR) repeat protein